MHKIILMQIDFYSFDEPTDESWPHRPARRRGEIFSPRKSRHPYSYGAGGMLPLQSYRESEIPQEQTILVNMPQLCIFHLTPQMCTL